MIQWMLAIWSLIPLPFLKPAWTSGSSRFTYCWSLARRILSITLLVCEMSATVQQFEHPLALPFFGIGIKTDIFQSCSHCWVFQICWHIECSTFTESSFRIWNSSPGIPSPPLALFVVMLPRPLAMLPHKISLPLWIQEFCQNLNSKMVYKDSQPNVFSACSVKFFTEMPCECEWPVNMMG